VAIPTFAHNLNVPAAHHEEALSLICAGVLLAVFLLTLPGLIAVVEGEAEHAPPRWTNLTTVLVLGAAAVGAAFASDWFVTALKPATETLGMSEAFAGLVVVAIAGNAVENVVGVQLARQDRMDFAISVILNSSLQVALALTPVLVLASLLFAAHLTLVFPVMLAIALLFAAWLGGIVVYDGESTWPEGVVLIGLYVVVVSAFWWGA
jgi:Ca2+:H+ antiporter